MSACMCRPVLLDMLADIALVARGGAGMMARLSPRPAAWNRPGSPLRRLYDTSNTYTYGAHLEETHLTS